MKSIKIIVIIAIILVFLGVISLSRIQNKDISLKNESEINILAKKVEYYKGVITIEDSISISGNCPMLPQPEDNKGQVVLGDFSGPYRIIKKIVIQSK